MSQKGGIIRRCVPSLWEGLGKDHTVPHRPCGGRRAGDPMGAGCVI
jgi:hypothetical protein